MSLPEPQHVFLTVDANHPNFLTGLALWLQLGLLTERQVRQIGQDSLTCTLPQSPVAQPVPVSQLHDVDQPSPIRAKLKVVPPHRSSHRQTMVEQVLRSLQQELSVVWLLVLGVFLVVVSSAVLVASQWQHVSSIGQYLVLLSYTIVVWGVSRWAGHQSNLQLTAATLQTLALLLFSVNFWAIDRFLLQSIQLPFMLTATVAAVLLTTLTRLVFQQRFSGSDRLSLLLLYLFLSYLQCGWNLPHFPFVAVYLGTIAIGIAISPSVGFARLIFPIVAISLLFLRAIFIAQVDVTQLGLALGILGWFATRAAQQYTTSSLWLLSGSLLVGGWFVSVVNVPWQSLVVSGIALWSGIQLLQRYWLKSQVTGLLIVGLQSIWLLWRLVPVTLQAQAFNIAADLTQTQSKPFALLGIVLLPYLAIVLLIAHWFKQHQKLELAQHTEAIAIVFGVGLTLISAFAPATRTLNLFASTIALGSLARPSRSRYRSFVYVTHLVGLGALISWIQYQFPTLNAPIWADIFLGIAIAEWSFSLLQSNAVIWQRSAWNIGFGVAALSYALLLAATTESSLAIGWLLIPAMLTCVAIRDELRREIAIWSSTIALVMAQALTQGLTMSMHSRETGLIGLGFATVLMVVNSGCVQRLKFAYLTIGFGLASIAWWIWHWFSSFPVEQWLLVTAIEQVTLWQYQRWGQSRRSALIRLFAQAAARWARILCALTLVGLSVQMIQVYHYGVTSHLSTIAASVVTTAAILEQTWRRPSVLSCIGIGVSIELFVAALLGWFAPSLLWLSVANAALGWLTQLARQVLTRKTRSEQWLLSWNALSLGYGVFAVLLRWGNFEAWTGWLSLSIAFILIAIGRHQPGLRVLTYVGLFGVSIAASELLLYPIRTLELSDQLIAIASLGAVITQIYRSRRPALVAYLRLSAEEIQWIAHTYWALSSAILSMAAILTLTAPTSRGLLSWVGLVTGMTLSLYAIWQARYRSSQETVETWLYAGLLEAAGLAWYVSTKLSVNAWFSVIQPYAGAISAIVAFFIFMLPWDRLGWTRQPWQRVALGLPVLVLSGTAAIVHSFSLIIIALFYTLVAKLRRQIRWTYLSIGLLNWFVLTQLQHFNIDQLFWRVLPIGLSILYIAQVEPVLRRPSERSSRHYIRLAGTSLICITALLTHDIYGVLAGITSLIAIFAGLGLRTRAFLYVGTSIFLLDIINQLIVLVTLYSMLKWVIGLCLGIALIWVAASFETRREQIAILMQNWFRQLQEWY
jgi:hypothetical protein